MNRSNKKTLAIVVGIVVIALLAGFFWYLPRAQANPLTTFLNDLFSPLASRQSALSGTNSASSSVSMYQPVDQYEQDVVNAVKTASPAVVSITISEDVPVVESCPYNPFQDLPPEFQQFFGGDGSGGSGDSSGGSSGFTEPCDTGQTQMQEVGGGSGFIISSDGLILTNKHVVSDTDASYSVLTNDGKTYTAKVLARDPNQDLAVLKINATGLPTVTLGDSQSLELGQTAIAIGNALGQFSNTVSVGVISGLQRTVTASSPETDAQETIADVIQTDAAINPGNSGGPLLNLRGQVIGIDTAIASDAQNIGFAIPIDQAKSVISSVEATGQIQAPYLGVRYLMVTPDIATAQNLPISYGALVRGDDTGPAVVAGSPAAKAGIQAEDIIESVNGEQLTNGTDLGDMIDQFNVGQTITLVVNRSGKELTIPVTLAVRPASADD